MTAALTLPATAAVHSLTDEQIVDRVLAGDSELYAVLVHRHHARVYGALLSMMRNAADAAELTQDAFLNAYRKLDAFRGDAAFGSWLRRIATNGALMRLRSRRRHPEVRLEPARDGEAAPIDPADPRPAVDLALMDHELGSHISRAMETLSPSYRAVFVLADLQHHSMREISELLGISVPNTKSRLHRARLKLRDALTPYLEAEPTRRAAFA